MARPQAQCSSHSTQDPGSTVTGRDLLIRDDHLLKVTHQGVKFAAHESCVAEHSLEFIIGMCVSCLNIPEVSKLLGSSLR